MKFSFGLFAAAVAAGASMSLISESAQAQSLPFRTWVSGRFGNNANNCDSPSAPCATFGVAITKTALNGEINCLDPGEFGNLNITKSITIDCHDAFGSMLTSGSGGISILFDNFSAGDGRKTVRLRNINVNGAGSTNASSGLFGINIAGGSTITGGSVYVEDCLIDGNFNGTGGGRGITDSRSGGGKLIITNTTIRNNGGGGVSAFPTSGSTNIQVLLNNVRSYGNGTGAQFGPGTRVMIDQSTFDGNTGGGIRAEGGSIVSVDRSTVSHNAQGIAAAGGTVTLANTNITFNTSSGIAVSAGGTVQSYGNNRIGNNASPGTVPFLIGSTTNPTGHQ